MVLRGGFLGGLGRLGGFGEFLLDIDGVAGDVFAALTKEEPDKDEDGTAKGEETVFDGVRPVGGKENHGIDDAKADGIDVAASEDDFLSEGEIALRQGIIGAIVGVTKDFAVDEEVATDRGDEVVGYDDNADHPVNLDGEEENLGTGE